MQCIPLLRDNHTPNQQPPRSVVYVVNRVRFSTTLPRETISGERAQVFENGPISPGKPVRGMSSNDALESMVKGNMAHAEGLGRSFFNSVSKMRFTRRPASGRVEES